MARSGIGKEGASRWITSFDFADGNDDRLASRHRYKPWRNGDNLAFIKEEDIPESDLSRAVDVLSGRARFASKFVRVFITKFTQAAARKIFSDILRGYIEGMTTRENLESL